MGNRLLPLVAALFVQFAVSRAQFDCDFESGLCGWVQATDDDFDWTRNQGTTSTSNSGPSSDHTTGNGYYVYIEASNKNPDDRARIVSPDVTVSGARTKCLTFWYHMYGSHVDSFNVYWRVGGTLGNPIWTRQGDQGNLWTEAKIDITAGQGQVVLEGVRGTSFRGDIAVDDVTLTDGACAQVVGPSVPPGGLQCDFEDVVLCGYAQDTDDDFDWTWQSSSTATSGTGPGNDHTYGTSAGHYLYTETSSPRVPGDVARLSSPTYPQTSGQCLEFYYHMMGADIGTLNVYASVAGNRGFPIWTLSGEQGNQWTIARVTVSTTGDFQIVFEGVRGANYRGDIAIDDVALSAGPCQGADGNCDFETDLCTWTNAQQGDDFDWVLNTGNTGSSGTGPDADHTLGNAQGQYYYIESSSPRVQGERAHLVSQTFSGSAGTSQCLSFWYHMYGTGTGALRVRTQINGVDTVRWALTGDQGNQWRNGQVSVGEAGDYQVLIEGEIGTNFRSDISLDDVAFTAGPCSVLPANAAPAGATTAGPITLPGTTLVPTVPTNAPGGVDCNFEVGVCGWTQATGDDFDWSRDNSGTPSANTGPATDHTVGTSQGYYLYTEASSKSPGDIAQVSSPDITATRPKCFRFWYHMWGNTMGSLNVYIQTGPALPSNAVWTRSGNQGNQWREAAIDIYNLQYNIVFEAVRGSDIRSDIAVDDVTLTEGLCNAPVTPGTTCDFEAADICSYTQDTTDDFDWTRKTGGTGSGSTGPSQDHTLGTGNYMYTEASGKQQGDVARLLSPQQTADPSGQCLQFYYHMYGTQIGTLNVYAQVGASLGNAVWTRTGNQDDQWHFAMVDVTTTSNYQLVFEGIIGAGVRGDIAIDDVTISNGPCPSGPVTPTLCDFELDVICMYTQDQSDDFNWRWDNGGTTSGSTGPAVDHTYGTSAGHYMYTEASSPQSPGDVARLTSHLYLNNSIGQCLDFWYHMYGNQIGTLNVYARTGSTMSNALWFMSADQGNQWNRAQVDLPVDAAYQVVFEGVLGTGVRGDIAIDDVNIVPGSCPRPGNCNFETAGNRLCTWSNDQTNDEFDWIEGSGSTASTGTGPSADHTLGDQTGFYMFLEASSPRQPGERARLVSELFPPVSSSGRCLRFWYHMNGADIGTLRVFLKAQGQAEQPIWELSGDKGDQWLNAQVGINSNNDYTIILEGVRGQSHRGDIAIDDVTFVDTSCNLSPADAVPSTSTLPTTTIAAVTTAPGLFDCTFETDFCGWTQDTQDNFDWTRQLGTTGSTNTGPSFDHTVGDQTGYYIFIETSSPQVTGDKARLYSPTVVPTSTMCLQFWYHMYGEHIETLNVYIQTGPALPTIPTFQRTGTQGDQWVRAEVEVNTTSPYQVVMEGIRGTGYRGDIALDDITMSTGPCTTGTTYGINCDFEDSTLCGYVQKTDDQFDWTWQTGSTGTSNTGPQNDHTLGTSAGHYMYIETSSPRQPGDIAVLMTPTVTGDNRQHCLQFYYHMYGADIGTLRLWEVRGTEQPRIVWEVSGDQGNQWSVMQWGVVPSIDTYFMFEGIRGNSFRGDISLDDVSYLNQRCIGASSGNCDFEGGPCTWSNTQVGDDFDWTEGYGSTGSTGTGPSIDHTTSSDQGKYMFIESSAPTQPGQNARWQSEQFPATAGSTRCMKFWYHMYGSGIGTLNVLIQEQGLPDRILWQLSSDQGDQWLDGQLEFSSLDSYRIVFEAVRGLSHTGDIAIDDITFLDTGCNLKPINANPPTSPTLAPTSATTGTFDCDFDTDTCGWIQATDDEFDWTRQNGGTGSQNTGPTTDHTSGSGFYMFIETSSPQVTGDKARLVSPLVSPTGTKCLTFWYHMYGDHVDSLNVYVQTGPVVGQPIWTKSGTQGNQWDQGQVDIPSNSQYNIVFEGVRGNGFRGDIAIDDVTMTDGSCFAATVSPQGVCGFEDNSLCGFTNDGGDIFDWTWQTGGTGTVNTGPTVDHTYGTSAGHFVFIETSSPRVPGDNAIFLSPTYQTTSPNYCVEFYYHMFGVNIGTLNVYAKKNGNLGTALWTLSGDQGDIWVMAQVTVTADNPFQVAFEGIRGVSYRGDIALDDISITPGGCGTPGTCDFENGYCTWTNDLTGDDFDWVTGTKASATTQTGPSFDHTTQNDTGTYLYLEASSPRLPGDVARLVSEAFPVATGRCLSFWYHMYGSGMGTLRVVLHETQSRPVSVWEVSGDQGDQWLQGQVPLTTSSSFQIYVEGVRGSDYRSDAAIDDFDYTSTACTLMPAGATPATPTGTVPTTPAFTGPTPTPGPFDCDFESGLCGWLQLTDDDFNWSRHQGITGSSNTGPSADHTTGNGYYIYIEASGQSANRTARVMSPSVMPASRNCLQFWYHMYGDDVGTLNVYIRVGTIMGDPLWTRSGTNGNRWVLAQIPVVGLTTYSVVLEGVRGDGFRGDIAVDDVSMLTGDCPPVVVTPSPSAPPTSVTCNFESDNICGYQQSQADDFDWTRGSGGTGTTNTGPSTDHTLGTNSGYYMYIETSSPRQPGDKAVLRTPSFPQDNQPHCVEFYYHMFGDHIGDLKVFYVPTTGSFPAPLWELSGDQGDHWYLGQVTVPGDQTFYVEFEAVRGQSFRGDIAIDDVTVRDGQCSNPGSCDFENGPCTYTNDPNDDFDWTEKRGSTSSTGTGPTTDHTTGTAQGKQDKRMIRT
ncbi:PREDICTED: MAM and LDL-receptor class A domain-containing protein 2-like [Branchiostoma belcheri]|uniref:MAM and LDL-receptor class A domain-containing protein 2-like n=1 Tax=Branchiostoma belcheri TaxID=7741 RepID=A0A6P4Z627_BRABE|nr:PREDICTED: MAM and LDL-receptor class A domain-containing protein 2-like [Branchiostoma belcheri]